MQMIENAVRYILGRSFGSKSRIAGDKARDAGKWREAAEHYKRHLADRPNHAAIWIQLGHCLKETGRIEDARAAYQRAIAINDSADAQLQLGHALKLLGRPREAYDAYGRSHELQPIGNPAFSELLAGGYDYDDEPSLEAETEVMGRPKQVYLDLTDLVAYVRVNSSLSGIQRVVANLLAHLSELDQRQPFTVIPVLPNYRLGIMASVDLGAVLTLLDVVEARRERVVIDTALVTVLRSKRAVRPRQGDVFVIAGAFWIFHNYHLLNRLRLTGVDVAIFIHDLIQITDREYVEPAATHVFHRSWVDVLCTATFILTNSNFVASEVKRFLADRMAFSLPVIPVTLATELGAKTVPSSPRRPSALTALAGRDYVLVVSTIEIRKNHRYAVDVWERLLDDGQDVPDLVFVGKWGWQVEPLRAYLKKSRKLDGKLHIFNAISDDALEQLYRDCLFTFYPSFAEGWGLPIGESLAYGKPCIASNTTAMPEVGGDYCRYIDPHDIESGIRVVRDTLDDRKGLSDWAARIKREFRPKTWADFTQEFFNAILDENARSSGMHRNNLVIPSATVVPLGTSEIAAAYALERSPILSARMCCVDGWHGAEAWGLWAAKREATMLVFTDLAAGTPARLFLQLVGPRPELLASCRLRIEGGEVVEVRGLGSMPRWTEIRGVVGPQGELALTLQTVEPTIEDGDTNLIGVMAIAVAQTGNDEHMRVLMASLLPAWTPCPKPVPELLRPAKRAVGPGKPSSLDRREAMAPHPATIDR